MAKTTRKSKAIINTLKAKMVYAEGGEVNSCEDWLALALKEGFRTEGGSFDLTAFKACLKENEIEPPKVDMERHGAIGRFRMCAGLMLRRDALKIGYVVIDEKKIAATRREEARTQGEDGRSGRITSSLSALHLCLLAGVVSDFRSFFFFELNQLAGCPCSRSATLHKLRQLKPEAHDYDAGDYA